MILASCAILTILSLISAISTLRISHFSISTGILILLASSGILTLLCQTSDLVQFTFLASLFNICLTGLVYFRKSRRLVAEVSVQQVFFSLFQLCFFSAAIGWCIQTNSSTEFAAIMQPGGDRLAISLVFLALLIWIGSVPFLSSYADYVDAAPPFASMMLMGGTLISGGHVLHLLTLNPLNPKLFDILAAFGAFTLIATPLFALDQKRIDRMVSYLLFNQSGLLILLSIFQIKILDIYFLHLALAIPGALVGVRFWKHTQNSDKNWEDYAGAGKKHPVVALAWLSILGSISGLPFTLGFSIYSELSKQTMQPDNPWLFPLIVASIVLAFTPVARLGLFMFAKPIRYELLKQHQPRQAAYIVLCAVLLLFAKIAWLSLSSLYVLQTLTAGYHTLNL